MKFIAKIDAIFSFDVEADNDEEALALAKTKLESSKFYHNGASLEFGQVWFYDIDAESSGLGVEAAENVND